VVWLSVLTDWWPYLGGAEVIRDFIAFPKNNAGRDVMIDAPATIDEAQLNELCLLSTAHPEEK
jgi:aspartyl-tRNA synthetase